MIAVILLEIAIGIVAITLLVAVLVLARLTRRVGQAADDIALAARRLTELTPAARTLIEAGRAELESLRSITGTTAHIVEDVRAVSGRANAVTSNILRGFESEVFARYRAVFAGARAGIDLLRHVRGGNGSHEAQSLEEEEFSHVTHNKER
jgi:hypothetical protein